MNHNWRILTWILSGCQNFPRPLLRHHCHPVHLHAVTAARSMSPPARPSLSRPGTTLSRSSSVVAVPLLLPHHRRHPASPPPLAPHLGPSLHLPNRLHRRRHCHHTQELHYPSGHHRCARNLAILLAVTIAVST
jgi:hypothetical protein